MFYSNGEATQNPHVPSISELPVDIVQEWQRGLRKLHELDVQNNKQNFS
jgi:hypothetical protein